MTRLPALLAGMLLGACAAQASATGAAPSATGAAPSSIGAQLDRHLSARVTCSPLRGVKAGSGLLQLGRRLLVAQDSAAAVALVTPDSGQADQVVLTGRGTTMVKAEKPDYESVMLAPGGNIYVLGSGSAAPRRTVVRLERAGDGIGRIATVDAGSMYDAIAGALGFTPNIEGALAVRDRVWLFHRGAGPQRSARIEVSVAALDGGAPGRPRVTWLDLGRVGRVPLTITDAIGTGRQGQILYLAVAEDTPNAIDDGPIVGAAIGLVEGARGRYARIVERDGAQSTRKFEGVALDAEGRSGWLVTDPDDDAESAQLCRLQLDGPW